MRPQLVCIERQCSRPIVRSCWPRAARGRGAQWKERATGAGSIKVIIRRLGDAEDARAVGNAYEIYLNPLQEFPKKTTAMITAGSPLYSIIGPILGAFIVGSFAYFIAHHITHRLERLRLVLAFNDRFHSIVHDMATLRIKYHTVTCGTSDSAVLRELAYDLFRQFFSLMVDQLQAFREGFVETELMTYWMTMRAYDFDQGHYEGHGHYERLIVADLTYAEAWKRWSTRPIVSEHDIVGLLNKVHGVEPVTNKQTFRDASESVKRIVGSYHKRWHQHLFSAVAGVVGK